MMSIDPLENLFDRQRRKVESISHAATLSKQLCQGGATWKTPKTGLAGTYGLVNVVSSVGFQYGSNLAKATPRFWDAVTNGRWQDAVDELRNFGDSYSTRRNKEADLLQKAIDHGDL